MSISGLRNGKITKLSWFKKKRFLQNLVMVTMKAFILIWGMMWTVVPLYSGCCMPQPSHNTDPDTIVYFPGAFQWDERTVVQPPSHLVEEVTRYLDILDHVNVDFGVDPQSVVRLVLQQEAGYTGFEILVLEDTIQVTAATEPDLDRALHRLAEMKKDGERRSPDYGLIYIRCGLYRFENF